MQTHFCKNSSDTPHMRFHYLFLCVSKSKYAYSIRNKNFINRRFTMKKLFNLFSLTLALIIFPASSVRVSAVNINPRILKSIAEDYCREFVELLSVIAANPDKSFDELPSEFTDEYLDGGCVTPSHRIVNKQKAECTYYKHLNEYFDKYSDDSLNEYIHQYFLKKFEGHPEKLVRISNQYLRNRIYNLQNAFVTTLKRIHENEPFRDGMIFLFSFISSFSSATKSCPLQGYYHLTKSKVLKSHVINDILFDEGTGNLKIHLKELKGSPDFFNVISITLYPKYPHKFLSVKALTPVPEWVFNDGDDID